MPSRRKSPGPTFVSRYGLWSAAQERAAVEVERAIRQQNLEVVRFSFADQHGVLRGKTLLASEAVSAMRNGVTMTSTLLAKDTSHKSVFPVFTAGGGFCMAEMKGGADIVMEADPTTFRVQPWSANTGWL
jgi:glutamine synthetase